MLVLSRKRGQTILINDNIEIYISAIEGDSVKIGINAPENVTIMRKELLDEVQANNVAASISQNKADIIKNIKKLKKT